MKDFVDGSGLQSVAESDEFRAMYSEACQIYKEEGGHDELGKQNVKVHPTCGVADNRIVSRIFDSGK